MSSNEETNKGDEAVAMKLAIMEDRNALKKKKDPPGDAAAAVERRDHPMAIDLAEQFIEERNESKKQRNEPRAVAPGATVVAPFAAAVGPTNAGDQAVAQFIVQPRADFPGASASRSHSKVPRKGLRENSPNRASNQSRDSSPIRNPNESMGSSPTTIGTPNETEPVATFLPTSSTIKPSIGAWNSTSSKSVDPTSGGAPTAEAATDPELGQVARQNLVDAKTGLSAELVASQDKLELVEATPLADCAPAPAVPMEDPTALDPAFDPAVNPYPTEDQEPNKKRRMIAAGLLVLLVLLAIGVAVAVPLAIGSNGSSGCPETDIVTLFGESFCHSTTTSINIQNTELAGTIPTEVGLMTSLTVFDLEDNQVEGTIPTEVGLMTALSFLDLRNNKLTGLIPSELGLLSNVTRFYLDKNELTEEVPSSLCSLSTDSRISCDVCDVMCFVTLFGESFSRSTTTKINIQDTELAGTIPTEVGLLTSVTVFDLEDNKVEGTIPTELGLMTALSFLDLRNNNLEGLIPSELGLLSNVTRLYLDKNDLTGTVPSSLCSLPADISISWNTQVVCPADCGESCSD